MSTKNIPHCQKLHRLAARAQHRWAFHAVIVKKGGAVIASGYNHEFMHAETVALNKIWPSKRAGTTVWSVRINKSGSYANGKPCVNCEAYLRKNNVKDVYYTTPEGIKRMKL